MHRTHNDISVLIVDDEPITRRGLRQLISGLKGVTVVSEAGTGPDAVDRIRETRPDLVLLDIQMPGCDGFEVVSRIGTKEMPPVIFVTAFDEYALKAFDTHALDYILKPIDPERFEEAIDRARLAIERGRQEDLGDRLTQMLAEKNSAKRVTVRDAERILFMDISDIFWLESAGNYVQMHSVRGRFLERSSMKALEQTYGPYGFIRISRSALVNMECIAELRQRSGSTYSVHLKNGTVLHSSRRFAAGLQKLISNQG